jgi:hypothetical protein
MSLIPFPLPVASYQLPDLRAGSKRLVNCFPVVPSQNPTVDDTKDSQQLVALRRWPGITTIASNIGAATGGLRGIWEMGGILYLVVGSVFGSLTSAGNFTQLNAGTPIPGNGFVRMTDNTSCLVILVPGTDQAFTYTPSSIVSPHFATLSNAFFLTLGGAIDCWFIDTFVVFLANNNNGNGSYTFFNDDGKQVSGVEPLTFTTAASFTRQFGTDPFFGICVDHREVLAFGSRSTEGFVNTGNASGSPFSTAPDTYMPYGMHPSASFTIALQDNSVFWVCNDLTVRRREGQTPVRVSDEGIENILQTAAANNLLAGAYALAPTFGGSPFYVLTIPLMQRSLAYNCVTQKWFELSSQGLNANGNANGVQQQWRAQAFFNGFGLQLIGDAQSPTIGYLDQNTQTEFGTTPVVAIFMTQPVFNKNVLITTWRIEAVVTAGAGAIGNPAPKIQLFLSDNWGQTFYSFDDENQTLGVPGDTDNRAVWFTLGEHRSLVPQFLISDPSPLFTVSVTADVEMGLEGY